ERMAMKAIAAAKRVEAAGPASAADAAWSGVIDTWYGDVDAEVLAPAADGVVHAALAGVHEPFTIDQLDAERRVLARYEQLPAHLRTGAARERLARALLG